MAKTYGQMRQERDQKRFRYLMSFVSTKINTIIQVGLGPWSEGEIFKEQFPDASIIAIDPVERYFINARKIGFAGESFVKAVWNRSGEILTFSDRRMKTSVLVNNGSGVMSIETITLDDVVKQAKGYKPPVLLWMDCEGCELKALDGASEMLHDVDWILSELNERKHRRDNWPSGEEVIERLNSLGFTMVAQEHDGLFRRVK